MINDLTFKILRINYPNRLVDENFVICDKNMIDMIDPSFNQIMLIFCKGSDISIREFDISARSSHG